MRLSLGKKILAGFTIDLVLMGALGAFALHSMRVMDRQATFVESTTIPSLQNVDELRDLLTEIRVLQLEFGVQRSSADLERLEGRLTGISDEMDRRLDAQASWLVGEDDRRFHGEVRSRWSELRRELHERFLPSMRLGGSGSVQPALSRTHPAMEAVRTATEELAGHVQESAGRALDVARSSYLTSYRFVLADTLVSIALSAFVGIFLAVSISRRVRRLRQATQRVARGDLAQPVEPRGGDEIEDLAEAFNTMLTALRTHRSQLEARNGELALSLERQRQLTNDLLDRTRAEAEAREAHREAEEASREKSLFLATMSHELRTPLTAILGYAQLMHLSTRDRGEETHLLELERIQTAGRHLLTLISNVLDFSKIERGEMDVDACRFDARRLATEVLDIVRPLAEERDDRLELDAPEGALPMWSDAGKLRQILFNLVSNAVKFTDDGTICLQIRRDDDHVVFRIRDEGIGITEPELRHLFEPFQQTTEGRFRGGAGLGLAVSRHLALALGGDVSADSVPGEGSTFTVRLPAELPPPVRFAGAQS